MSPEHGGSSCAEISPALPELALGVLTGRDRVVALAHTESCSPCADELEQLARAADAVVLVAPELEPPVGFEVRLFSRMGVSDDVPTPIRRRRPYVVPGLGGRRGGALHRAGRRLGAVVVPDRAYRCCGGRAHARGDRDHGRVAGGWARRRTGLDLGWGQSLDVHDLG